MRHQERAAPAPRFAVGSEVADDASNLFAQAQPEARTADVLSARHTTYVHRHLLPTPIFKGKMKVVNPHSTRFTRWDLATISYEQLFSSAYYACWSARRGVVPAEVLPAPPDYDSDEQLGSDVRAFIQGCAATYATEKEKPIRPLDLLKTLILEDLDALPPVSTGAAAGNIVSRNVSMSASLSRAGMAGSAAEVLAPSSMGPVSGNEHRRLSRLPPLHDLSPLARGEGVVSPGGHDTDAATAGCTAPLWSMAALSLGASLELQLVCLASPILTPPLAAAMHRQLSRNPRMAMTLSEQTMRHLLALIPCPAGQSCSDKHFLSFLSVLLRLVLSRRQIPALLALASKLADTDAARAQQMEAVGGSTEAPPVAAPSAANAQPSLLPAVPNAARFLEAFTFGPFPLRVPSVGFVGEGVRTTLPTSSSATVSHLAVGLSQAHRAICLVSANVITITDFAGNEICKRALRALLQTSDSAWSVQFSPDGTTLLVSAACGKLHVRLSVEKLEVLERVSRPRVEIPLMDEKGELRFVPLPYLPTGRRHPLSFSERAPELRVSFAPATPDPPQRASVNGVATSEGFATGDQRRGSVAGVGDEDESAAGRPPLQPHGNPGPSSDAAAAVGVSNASVASAGVFRAPASQLHIGFWIGARTTGKVLSIRGSSGETLSLEVSSHRMTLTQNAAFGHAECWCVAPVSEWTFVHAQWSEGVFTLSYNLTDMCDLAGIRNSSISAITPIHASVFRDCEGNFGPLFCCQGELTSAALHAFARHGSFGNAVAAFPSHEPLLHFPLDEGCGEWIKETVHGAAHKISPAVCWDVQLLYPSLFEDDDNSGGGGELCDSDSQASENASGTLTHAVSLPDSVIRQAQLISTRYGYYLLDPTPLEGQRLLKCSLISNDIVGVYPLAIPKQTLTCVAWDDTAAFFYVAKHSSLTMLPLSSIDHAHAVFDSIAAEEAASSAVDCPIGSIPWIREQMYRTLFVEAAAMRTIPSAVSPITKASMRAVAQALHGIEHGTQPYHVLALVELAISHFEVLSSAGKWEEISSISTGMKPVVARLRERFKDDARVCGRIDELYRVGVCQSLPAAAKAEIIASVGDPDSAQQLEVALMYLRPESIPQIVYSTFDAGPDVIPLMVDGLLARCMREALALVGVADQSGFLTREPSGSHDTPVGAAADTCFGSSSPTGSPSRSPFTSCMPRVALCIAKAAAPDPDRHDTLMVIVRQALEFAAKLTAEFRWGDACQRTAVHTFTIPLLLAVSHLCPQRLGEQEIGMLTNLFSQAPEAAKERTSVSFEVRLAVDLNPPAEYPIWRAMLDLSFAESLRITKERTVGDLRVTTRHEREIAERKLLPAKDSEESLRGGALTLVGFSASSFVIAAKVVVDNVITEWSELAANAFSATLIASAVSQAQHPPRSDVPIAPLMRHGLNDDALARHSDPSTRSPPSELAMGILSNAGEGAKIRESVVKQMRASITRPMYPVVGAILAVLVGSGVAPAVAEEELKLRWFNGEWGSRFQGEDKAGSREKFTELCEWIVRSTSHSSNFLPTQPVSRRSSTERRASEGSRRTSMNTTASGRRSTSKISGPSDGLEHLKMLLTRSVTPPQLEQLLLSRTRSAQSCVTGLRTLGSLLSVGRHRTPDEIELHDIISTLSTFAQNGGGPSQHFLEPFTGCGIDLELLIRRQFHNCLRLSCQHLFTHVSADISPVKVLVDRPPRSWIVMHLIALLSHPWDALDAEFLQNECILEMSSSATGSSSPDARTSKEASLSVSRVGPPLRVVAAAVGDGAGAGALADTEEQHRSLPVCPEPGAAASLTTQISFADDVVVPEHSLAVTPRNQGSIGDFGLHSNRSLDRSALVAAASAAPTSAPPLPLEDTGAISWLLRALQPYVALPLGVKAFTVPWRVKKVDSFQVSKEDERQTRAMLLGAAEVRALSRILPNGFIAVIPGVQVSNTANGILVNKSVPGVLDLRSDTPWPINLEPGDPKIFYYEVTLKTQVQRLAIMVEAFAPPHTVATGGIGFFSFENKGLFTSFAGTSIDGAPFADNDTVGCGLLASTREVFFTLNGHFLGIAGRIPADFIYPWHPLVSLENKDPTSIVVNFGVTPFHFDFRTLHPSLTLHKGPTWHALSQIASHAVHYLTARCIETHDPRLPSSSQFLLSCARVVAAEITRLTSAMTAVMRSAGCGSSRERERGADAEGAYHVGAGSPQSPSLTQLPPSAVVDPSLGGDGDHDSGRTSPLLVMAEMPGEFLASEASASPERVRLPPHPTANSKEAAARVKNTVALQLASEGVLQHIATLRNLAHAAHTISPSRMSEEIGSIVYNAIRELVVVEMHEVKVATLRLAAEVLPLTQLPDNPEIGRSLVDAVYKECVARKGYGQYERTTNIFGNTFEDNDEDELVDDDNTNVAFDDCDALDNSMAPQNSQVASSVKFGRRKGRIDMSMSAELGRKLARAAVEHRIPFVPHWALCDPRFVSIITSETAQMMIGSQRSIVLGSVLPRTGISSFTICVTREHMMKGHSMQGGYFVGVAACDLQPLSPPSNALSWKVQKPPKVWALHDTSPQLPHAVNPTVRPNNFQRTFGSGDVIKVVVDRTTSTVSFWRDGVFLKDLFVDLPTDIDICPFAQLYNEDAAVTLGPGECTPSITPQSLLNAVAVDALRSMITLPQFHLHIAKKLCSELEREKWPLVVLGTFGSIPDPRMLQLRLAGGDVLVQVRSISGTRCKVAVGNIVAYDEVQNLHVPLQPEIRGNFSVRPAGSALAGVDKCVRALMQTADRITWPLINTYAYTSLEVHARSAVEEAEALERNTLQDTIRIDRFRHLHHRSFGPKKLLTSEPSSSSYAFSAPLSHPCFSIPARYCGKLVTVPSGSPNLVSPFIAIAEPAVPHKGKFNIRMQLIRGHPGQLLGGGYYIGICTANFNSRRRDVNATPADVWAIFDMDEPMWRVRHMLREKRIPMASDSAVCLVSGDTVRLEVDRDLGTMHVFRKPSGAHEEIPLGLLYDAIPQKVELYPFVQLYNADSVAILLPGSQKMTPQMTASIRATVQIPEHAELLRSEQRKCDGCASMHREAKVVAPDWFKCNECADFNLCPNCYAMFLHSHHSFTRMDPSNLVHSSDVPRQIVVKQSLILTGTTQKVLRSERCRMPSQNGTHTLTATASNAVAYCGLLYSEPTAPLFRVRLSRDDGAFPPSTPAFVGVGVRDDLLHLSHDDLWRRCVSADSTMVIFCSDAGNRNKFSEASRCPYGFSPGDSVAIKLNFEKRTASLSRDWITVGVLPLNEHLAPPKELVGFALFGSAGTTASFLPDRRVTTSVEVTEVFPDGTFTVVDPLGQERRCQSDDVRVPALPVPLETLHVGDDLVVLHEGRLIPARCAGTPSLPQDTDASIESNVLSTSIAVVPSPHLQPAHSTLVPVELSSGTIALLPNCRVFRCSSPVASCVLRSVFPQKFGEVKHAFVVSRILLILVNLMRDSALYDVVVNNSKTLMRFLRNLASVQLDNDGPEEVITTIREVISTTSALLRGGPVLNVQLPPFLPGSFRESPERVIAEGDLFTTTTESQKCICGSLLRAIKIDEDFIYGIPVGAKAEHHQQQDPRLASPTRLMLAKVPSQPSMKRSTKPPDDDPCDQSTEIVGRGHGGTPQDVTASNLPQAANITGGPGEAGTSGTAGAASDDGAASDGRNVVRCAAGSCFPAKQAGGYPWWRCINGMPCSAVEYLTRLQGPTPPLPIIPSAAGPDGGAVAERRGGDAGGSDASSSRSSRGSPVHQPLDSSRESSSTINEPPGSQPIATLSVVTLHGEWRGELITSQNSSMHLCVRFDDNLSTTGHAEVTLGDGRIIGCDVRGVWARYARTIKMTLTYPAVGRHLTMEELRQGLRNFSIDFDSTWSQDQLIARLQVACATLPAPHWSLTAHVDFSGLRIGGRWKHSEGLTGTFTLHALRSAVAMHPAQLTSPGNVVEPLPDIVTPPAAKPRIRRVADKVFRLVVLLARHLTLMYHLRQDVSRSSQSLAFPGGISLYHAHPLISEVISMQQTFDLNVFLKTMFGAISLIHNPQTRNWDLESLASILIRGMLLRPAFAIHSPAIFFDALHAIVVSAHRCRSEARAKLIYGVLQLIEHTSPSLTLADVTGVLLAWTDHTCAHSHNSDAFECDVLAGVELTIVVRRMLRGVRGVSARIGKCALPLAAFNCLIDITNSIKTGQPLPATADEGLLWYPEDKPWVNVVCPFGQFERNELTVGKVQSSLKVKIRGTGRFYFEVVIPQQIGAYAVGWGTEAHLDVPSQHVGADANSFAFNGREVSMKNVKEEYSIGVEASPHSIVGALLDLNERVVAWSVNGRVGPFIPLPIQNVEADLIAFVSTSSCSGMLIEMRAEGFHYIPDNFTDLSGRANRVTVTNRMYDPRRRSALAPRSLPFYIQLSSWMTSPAGVAARKRFAHPSGVSEGNTSPANNDTLVVRHPAPELLSTSQAERALAQLTPPQPAPSSRLSQLPLGPLQPPPLAAHGTPGASSPRVAGMSSSVEFASAATRAAGGPGTVSPAAADADADIAAAYPLLASTPTSELVRYASHLLIAESCMITAQRYADLETDEVGGVLAPAFVYLRQIVTTEYRKKIITVPLLEANSNPPSVVVRFTDLYSSSPRTPDVALQTTVLAQLLRRLSSLPDTQFNSTPLFRTLLHLTESGHTPQDLGGPYRQVWTLLGEELMCHPDRCFPHTDFHRNPLFRFSNNSARTCLVPDHLASSPFDLQCFAFLGKLMGHMARARTPIPLDISPFVWKFLVEDDLTVRDYYNDVDSVVENSVADDDFLISDVADDVIPLFGQRLMSVEMSEAERSVDDGGRSHRRRIAEESLVHSMDRQLSALRRGMWAVVPKRVIRCMRWEDLERAVCGEPTPTAAQLRANMTVQLAPIRDQFLSRVLDEMTDDQRSQFLCFVCGQKRLPIPKKLRVVENSESLDHLPRSQSCSGMLTLPQYTSYEVFKQKLLQAIAHPMEMELA